MEHTIVIDTEIDDHEFTEEGRRAAIESMKNAVNDLGEVVRAVFAERESREKE